MNMHRTIRIIFGALVAIMVLSAGLVGAGIVLRISEGNWLAAVLLMLAGGLALANLIRFWRNYDNH